MDGVIPCDTLLNRIRFIGLYGNSIIPTAGSAVTDCGPTARSVRRGTDRLTRSRDPPNGQPITERDGRQRDARPNWMGTCALGMRSRSGMFPAQNDCSQHTTDGCKKGGAWARKKNVDGMEGREQRI